MKGEAAVLADNKGPVKYLPLTVADNIRSSLSRYSTPHKILNQQFYFNYVVLHACKSTEGTDDFAAFKMAKRC